MLVITDGVFSMEGDLAPLPELLAVTERYGATLIVDDSHGLGVIGAKGRGVCEHFGCLGRDDVIITGTIGKALGGAAGGSSPGPRRCVRSSSSVAGATLLQRPAPPSRAVPDVPSRSCAITLELLERLRDNTDRFRHGIEAIGLRPLEGESAIVPVVVGETSLAMRFSEQLIERGVYVTGFGYPVVLEGTARVRAQISAALTEEQIDRALAAFSEVAVELGLVLASSAETA